MSSQRDLERKNHVEEMLEMLISRQNKAQRRYEEDLLYLGHLGTSPLPLIRKSGEKKKIPVGHPLYPRALEFWTKVLTDDINEFLSGKIEKQIEEKRKELAEIEAKINP
jgi:hypothetical protein